MSVISFQKHASSFMTKQYIGCQIIFLSSSASTLSQYFVSRIESPLWKCLSTLLRIPEMSLPAGLHPVRWTDESAEGEEGITSVAYDILWYHNASLVHVNLFCVWCTCNTITGIRNPFISFRTMVKFSKTLWSTFRNGCCQRLHSVVTIAKVWHCDLSSFKIVSMVVEILHLSMELLRSYHRSHEYFHA